MDVKSTTQLRTLPEFSDQISWPLCSQFLNQPCIGPSDGGEIPSLRVGKRFVLSRSHLEQWVEENICKKEACALWPGE